MDSSRERNIPGKAGWKTQLLLRGVGLVLLAAAWLAGRWLVARLGHGAGQGGGDLMTVAVASLVFIATTCGLMLTTLGPELMRQYEVPGRYRRHQ